MLMKSSIPIKEFIMYGIEDRKNDYRSYIKEEGWQWNGIDNALENHRNHIYFNKKDKFNEELERNLEAIREKFQVSKPADHYPELFGDRGI